MIVPVDKTNINQVAVIHSETWKDSHSSFCSAYFVALHTPEHQKEYLLRKMNSGSEFFMLVDDMPIGIVSVTDNLIEDLYVLPEKQHNGYGTELLCFATGKCKGTPTLWILENNDKARAFYLKNGFAATGRVKPGKIDEIELSLIGG